MPEVPAWLDLELDLRDALRACPQCGAARDAEARFNAAWEHVEKRWSPCDFCGDGPRESREAHATRLEDET